MVVEDSIFVKNCSRSLSAVLSSNIDLVELLVTRDEILLTKANVDPSISELEDFDNCVVVHE